MGSPLANKTYRRLFTAQVVALAGSGLTTIALALLAYDLAGANAGVVLGTALALKMVAAVGVAPIASVFASRLPRRAFLVGLDIARAGCVLCLPLITDIWQIYVLIFVLNACSAGFTPALQATIPDVLPDEAEYTRALSLSRLAYDLENLLSPTLAAAALLMLSYDALFVANAAGFIVSALLIASLRVPSPASARRAHGIWHDTTFGIRVYLQTPRLRGLLALSMAAAAAGAMVIVNTVVYVQDTLERSQSATAIAFAASGAGSMAVALLLPKLLESQPDRRFMLAGGLLLSGGLLLGLTEPRLLGLLPIWLLLGAGSSLIQTPAGRLLVRSANEHDRPLIYAAQFALSHGCWLIAYPLAGWIGAAFGLGTAFVVLAIIAFAATGIAVALWPAADPIELQHAHGPVAHDHLHSHDDHHQHDHEGTEGPEPHSHPHRHGSVTHTHRFVIDAHHPEWPA